MRERRRRGGVTLADAKELLQESITSLEELAKRAEGATVDEELKAVLERLSGVAAELKPVLGKVFLKTRQGMSAVLPVQAAVKDIVDILGEAIDGAEPGSALIEVQDPLDNLESNVASLRALVASRDVVMT